MYVLHRRATVADHGEPPRTRLDAPPDHQPVPRFEHVQRARHRREGVRAHEHGQVRVVVVVRLRCPVHRPQQPVLGVLQADHFVDEFGRVLFT